MREAMTVKQLLRMQNIRPVFAEMLARWVSPDEERSIAKGIPMSMLPIAYDLMDLFPAFRIKYRGPRPKGQGRSRMSRQSTCLKKDATSFTIYPK